MNEPTAIDRQRAQLLEAMSAVSEDRTCCGWASDWARTLHADGGVWEILGRAVGWPTGNYDHWVWLSWDEAARLYGHAATPSGPAPVPDRDTLRINIAETLAHTDGHTWGPGQSSLPSSVIERYHRLADAVLALLPASDQRAGALREAADVAAQWPSDCQSCATELEVARELRRAAGRGAAGPDTRLRTRTLTESEHSRAWHAIEGAAGEEGADPGTVLNAVLRALGINPPAVVADDSDDEGLSGPCDCGEGAVHYTTVDCPAAQRATA
ncbi:hypothetical protein AB0K09_15720 [Streptomyces sp. NPDC049577]|uniref:hypothetical protein n=1 Tax=Streptomyces sp. NPDC049577 TaxID=3155153 RepID=UPI00342E9AEC